MPEGALLRDGTSTPSPRIGRLGASAACASSSSAATDAFDTGGDELIVLPLAGACTCHDRRREVRAGGPRERLRRGHRLRLRAERRPRRDRSGPAAASRCPRPRAAAASSPATSRPRTCRSSCAAPATRPARSTTSAASEAFECRRADRRRGAHAGRQLVLVSAALGATTSSRRSTTSRSPRGGFAYQRVYDGMDLLAEVRTGDVIEMPCGYHGPSMARARLRPLLPQRDGRAPSARGTSSTIPSTPGSARLVGGPGDGPATADDVGEEARMRLTVAQALIRFLSVQYSERDGVEQRLIPGCFGIFGHGNVAGVGQALLEQPDDDAVLPRAQRAGDGAHRGRATRARRTGCDARVHVSSIGPGATNMVTGAALATINRLPVLLLPGDVFATRASGTVLQELEDPTLLRRVASTTRCARCRRFWDRVERPEQLVPRAAGGDARADRPGGDRRGHALPAAGRAGRGVRLAGGAVRAARVARAPAGARAGRAGRGRGAAARRADAADRRRRRHDLRRGDRRARARFAEATGIAVGETQAGKGSLPLRPSAGARRDRRDRHDRRQRRGARGRRGARRRHALERLHDRVALAVLRRRGLHQPQRRRRRRVQARRRCRSSPTRGSGSRR